MKNFYTVLLSVVILLSEFLPTEIKSQATTPTPPNAAALATWQVVRGSRKLEGTQYMKGNFSALPNVKWTAGLTGPNGGGEGECIIGDVNGDGTNEVLMVNGDKVWVFNGSTGAMIWNRTGYCNQTSVAIGDVNADGNIDILTLNDKAYLLNGATGAVIWQWTPPAAPNTGGAIPFSPANFIGTCPNIGDLDNDGIPEAVVVVNDGVYILNGLNGTLKWSYATTHPCGVNGFNGGAPAIGDLNNDGYLDVVANLESGQAGGSFGGTGGVVVAISGNGGGLMWSVAGPTNFGLGTPVPAIGDVNGDCHEDVVINKAALNGQTGATIWGNPSAGFGAEYCIIADLNDDCTVEVITGCGVYRGTDGSTVWQQNSCSQNGWFAPAPRVGDFNPSSPGKEIILAGAYDINTPISMYAGYTGTLLWAFSMASLNHTAEGVSVGDIDGDGCVEIVIAPDCCNGDPTVLALDDAPGATNCGILASISQADFLVSPMGTCGSIDVQDFSSLCASNWRWSFPGGSPSSSTSQNPGTINYGSSGTFTITMIITMNGCTDDTVTHTVTITTTVDAAISVLTDAGCGANNGSATVLATGGNGIFTYQWSGAGGNAATASNLAPGTYIVTVTSGACSDTALVTISTIGGLTVTSSSVDASCGNNNGSASVTPTTGTSPYTYNWSTGATTAGISNLAGGTYNYTVTDAGGCSVTGSVIVISSGGLLVDIGNDTTVCLPDTISFNATTGGATYQWSNGATSAIIQASTTNEYYVTVTSGGCTGIDSVHLTENPKPPASVTANQTVFCSGDSAQICGNAGMTSYLWNTGETTQCITTQLAGNYYVTLTDANGCSAASNHLSISVYSPPPVSVSVNGDTLTAYNASSYQWFLNGNIIPGATQQTYIATQGGSYTVQLTDSNGCAAASTAVIISGIAPLSLGEGLGVRIYPNPSQDGSWYLEVSNGLLGSQLEIFDAAGRWVFQSAIGNPKSEISPNISSGIYLLRISSAKNVVTRKLIKL